MKLNKFLLLLLLSPLYTLSQRSSNNIDSLTFINYNAESFLFKDSAFKDTNVKFYVIYNSMNCKDCFNKIDNTLKEYLLNDSLAKVYVITTVNEKEPYLTKYVSSLAKKKISSAKEVFFEVAKQEGLFEIKYPENGLFLKYKITVTPCILKIQNNEVKYFPFSSIFKNRKYNESWLL